MGGLDRCSEIKLGLLRRLAATTVQAEMLEARMVNGEACQNEILRELRRLLQHSCRVDGGSSRTSVSIHGLGYLLTALRRQGLIPDELVLQLATFLRSHDLFLELRVRTPRTLTANQARQGGKQGTDGRERSRIHFRCLALTSLLRSLRPKD
jgi:hypothetical protein